MHGSIGTRYLSLVSLHAEDLQRIAESQEVVIETRSGSLRLRTVIWVVVDDGDVLVRSVRGETGRWYQRALANPEVDLAFGDHRARLTAFPVTDPEIIERMSEGLRRKYRPGRSLDSMLRPEVLGATLRLQPAT